MSRCSANVCQVIHAERPMVPVHGVRKVHGIGGGQVVVEVTLGLSAEVELEVRHNLWHREGFSTAHLTSKMYGSSSTVNRACLKDVRDAAYLG